MPDLTVKSVVNKIKSDSYVIPGIQRNFVWSAKDICRLFDSLMQGLPLGSILLWKTSAAATKHLGFERFITESNGEGGTKIPSHQAGSVLAVLDGQQRLTALNIGLRGGIKHKTSGKVQRLWIDLSSENTDAAPDQDIYRFAFFADDPQRTDGEAWLPVATLLHSPGDVRPTLSKHGLPRSGPVLKRAKQLWAAIHVATPLVAQIETNPDLQHALRVFARINTGGTRLSYADLVVSVANQHWEGDAKSELRHLRKQAASVGEGFDLGAERMVKTALVLLGRDPKFTASSLTKANSVAMEKEWPRIAAALLFSCRLFDRFNLSGRALTAGNALIPIATYAYRRSLSDGYFSSYNETDRKRVHSFIARTLLKPGFWTGAVDPVLTTTRSVINTNGAKSFPLAALIPALERKKRPITFDESEIDELLDVRYNDPRALTLLRLLFPTARPSELTAPMEKDHVFPQSWFLTDDVFLSHGGHYMSVGRNDAALSAQLLPNLQLLDPPDNGHKRASAPRSWLAEIENAQTRRMYKTGQLLKGIPHDLSDVEEFWAARRELLRGRLAALLG